MVTAVSTGTSLNTTPGTAPKIRILALDGGGVRGVLSALFLTSLETELRRQSKNPDLRLGECFDLLAGTSTGGILAALLSAPDLSKPARPRFSADEVCTIFLNYLPHAFSNVRNKGNQGILSEKYDGRSLAMLMRMVFGRTRLSRLMRPCLITAYDMKERAATFFCSHDYYTLRQRARFRLAQCPPKPDWLLRDVCLATAAAPVFFKPAQIRPADADKAEPPHEFIDGGMFANNPALCAYAEVRAKWMGAPGVKDMLMLSVGTGLFDQQIQSGGYLTGWGGGIGLIELLMNAGTDAAHFAVERLYGTEPDSYHRINWELPHSYALDAAAPQKVEELFQAFAGRATPPARPKQADSKKADTWLVLGAAAAAHIAADMRQRLPALARQLLAVGKQPAIRIGAGH